MVVLENFRSKYFEKLSNLSFYHSLNTCVKSFFYVENFLIVAMVR